MKKPKWLRKGDTIVTAWAEYCSGPGWSNTPVWVIVQDRGGSIRRECLQPNEQSPEIYQLFHISAALQAQMLSTLTRWDK